MPETLTEAETKFFDTKGAEPPRAEPAAPAPEPAPEPPAEAKTAAEQAPPPAPEKPKQDTVPIGSLHEERARRKEAEQRARRVEERFEAFIAAQTKAQQPAPEPLPEDPDVRAQVIVDRRLREAAEYQQRTMSEAQQFQAAAEAAAAEFSAQQPDFMDGYRYLRQNQVEEYVEAGFDRATANQRVLADEQAIIQKAFHDGVNPAERLYKIAKRRGYKQVESKPAEVQPQRVEAIQRGQAAAQSLANASGKTPARLTLERLLDMDDAEFAKVDQRAWEKIWR